MPTPILLAFFALGNFLPVPAYALTILTPHWSITRRVMASIWSAAAPALLHFVYSIALAIFQPGVWGRLLTILLNPFGHQAMDTMTSMMARPEVAIEGWLHMLAASMVMARWAYLDSREQRMSAWLSSPTLALMLTNGPAGFVIYLIARLIHGAIQRKRTSGS